MMIYRVVIKVGYNEAAFEFESLRDAGDFARMVLTHQVGTGDTEKALYVKIEVRSCEEEEEEETEQED